MFSLEVQIRNLTSSTPSFVLPHQITLRFGPLQTDISISEESLSGGKRLLIDMQEEEMTNLFSTYVFGLFIQNSNGKFWSLISLEKINLEEEYLNNGLLFYDDDRNKCYEFGIGIKVKHFNPKMPKNKPEPELIDNTILNQPRNIKSFLNGKKNESPPKPQPPKRVNSAFAKPQPAKKINSATAKQPQKLQRENQTQYTVNTYQPNNNNFESINNNDSGIYIPPVMEFTNQEPVYSVPKLEYAIQNQNIGRNINTKDENTYEMYETKKPVPNKGNADKTVPKFEMFDNISHFKERNHDGDKIQLSKQQINREELREMARKEAERQAFFKKPEIMVPIPSSKTGTYELVPLSSLSEAQIIEYAEKQKMAEEYKKFQEEEKMRAIKKEEKRKKKLEHVGKPSKQAIASLKTQNMGITKQFTKEKISERNHESSDTYSDSEIEESNEVNLQKKPEIPRNSESEYDENYSEDFEVFSNQESLMKSRRSSHQSSMSNSRKKANESDISQSIDEYGYSNDFDSFSHSQSALSKNKRPKSGSEISESLKSLSYRK